MFSQAGVASMTVQRDPAIAAGKKQHFSLVDGTPDSQGTWHSLVCLHRMPSPALSHCIIRKCGMVATIAGRPTCRVAAEEAKEALASPGAPYRLHHSSLRTISNLQLACNAVEAMIDWCDMCQSVPTHMRLQIMTNTRVAWLFAVQQAEGNGKGESSRVSPGIHTGMG